MDLKSGGGGEAPSPAPFSGGGEEKSRDGGGGVGMSSAADGGGTPASPDARARSFQTHTRLFGTNNSCDWFNRQQLRNIPGEKWVTRWCVCFEPFYVEQVGARLRVKWGGHDTQKKCLPGT